MNEQTSSAATGLIEAGSKAERVLQMWRRVLRLEHDYQALQEECPQLDHNDVNFGPMETGCVDALRAAMEEELPAPATHAAAAEESQESRL